MKTFSFKLNKDGVAETNVPEEYFQILINVIGLVFLMKEIDDTAINTMVTR